MWPFLAGQRRWTNQKKRHNSSRNSKLTSFTPFDGNTSQPSQLCFIYIWEVLISFSKKQNCNHANGEVLRGRTKQRLNWTVKPWDKLCCVKTEASFFHLNFKQHFVGCLCDTLVVSVVVYVWLLFGLSVTPCGFVCDIVCDLEWTG